MNRTLQQDVIRFFAPRYCYDYSLIYTPSLKGKGNKTIACLINFTLLTFSIKPFKNKFFKTNKIQTKCINLYFVISFKE